MSLTPKQERFCQEYLIDLNATQAAIRAGYSEDSAGVIACQNLTKLNIQNRLSELAKARSERVGIDQDWVLENIRDMFEFGADKYLKVDDFGQPFIDVSGMTKDDLKFVESVKVDEYADGIGEDARQVKAITIKGVPNSVKAKLLELAAKHLRMFDEKEDADNAMQLHFYLPDNGHDPAD